jgi:hypothetical protein
MNIDELKLTKRGAAIEGKPQPGVYYSAMVPAGTDLRALREDLKKAFPKTSFNLRFSASPKPEAKK